MIERCSSDVAQISGALKNYKSSVALQDSVRNYVTQFSRGMNGIFSQLSATEEKLLTVC